ncbi:hypothetical protein ABQJ54_13480 [Rhodanobacter sp. Si-c]|uniref:DUF4034 domain-containing protein n=1 Tax=Rhodanobacter lycopersici TaxID=3162487 RepID=A0ABV3QGU8_9GAMM
MKARNRAWAALVGVAVCVAAGATDLRVPPIPAKDAAKVFPDAPEPWRDYLAKARAAERIADPLQRCLAFPDLPGNHWPEGHAVAHCAFHAMQDAPAIKLDELDGYLARGDTKGLRVRLDGYLARHYAKGALGEDIDVVFEQFDASERSDNLSRSWLQSAPNDPYANLARADYLLQRAWKARGKQYVADTSVGNLENMQAQVDQAIPLFDKASKLEPRLLPAYVGLMEAAMLTGRDELGEAAFAAAEKQDPACLYLIRQRMQSLRPRWGGSYEQLAAYMETLTLRLQEHPAIAIYLPWPYEDRASEFEGDEFYKSQAAALLDHAVDVGSHDQSLHETGEVALNRIDAPVDTWRGLALLLQEARFRHGDAWADRVIAKYLVRYEPEWAMQYLARAQKLAPDSGMLQYLLGAAHYNTHRYAEAQRYYAAAIKDPDYRQASLRELSAMWLYDAGLDRKAGAIKARPHVDRLLSEYPTDGRGWLYHFDCVARLGQGISSEDIKRFLAVADRDDPQQAKAIASFESVLKNVRTPLK